MEKEQHIDANKSAGEHMSDSACLVLLRIVLDERADDTEIGDAAQSILAEMRETVPAMSVIRSTPGDPGTKDAGQLISGGQILLSLLASGGVLATLIASTQGWLLRNVGKEVEIDLGGDKLRLKGISSAAQDKLVEVFLARHATRGS